jgi:predicted RNA-binding Zn-ribbon protein involved in translation (DUF1610 family)
MSKNVFRAIKFYCEKCDVVEIEVINTARSRFFSDRRVCVVCGYVPHVERATEKEVIECLSKT